MNMQNLMAQAKKMQNDLNKLTKELDEKVYEENSGPIELKISGKRQIVELKITDDGVLEDKEMLEDLLTTIINKVLTKIESERESKLGQYTGGMGGLF